MSELLERLEARIGGLGTVLVAFSGGVDSSLVAAVAARALGDRALAITAVSPALAAGELDAACEVARAIGIAHETIATDELASEDYRRNDRQRCFHCKSELYERLALRADGRTVLSGANADDAGDWRPGLRAAAAHGVVHPLLELGAGKAAVRELAATLGVPSADKPASPCLASRIPYGTPVAPETLARIDRAEAAVKALGVRELRVRHFGERARLEVGAAELDGLRGRRRTAALGAIRAAGYAHAELDEQPLRSGRLNEARS
jgi:pyridinium-3,5-biscarboxylic acid mononucleotide sulfurtransferase